MARIRERKVLQVNVPSGAQQGAVNDIDPDPESDYRYAISDPWHDIYRSFSGTSIDLRLPTA